MNDLRYALWILLKSPAVSAVAILTLALGIGATSAIFSVVNAVLLRRLPYKDPDRLVAIWENNRNRSRPHNVVGPANFLSWRDQATVFGDMGTIAGIRVNLTGSGEPEELSTGAVTPNLLPLLGVQPLIGRWFVAEDAQAERQAPRAGRAAGNLAMRAAILSHGLWLRRFGGDPAVVGKTIVLNGRSSIIVGVMPRDFQLFIKEGTLVDRPPDIWVPFAFTPEDREPHGRYLTVVGRLKPGVTLRQAQAEMDGIAARLERQHPVFDTGWGVTLVSLQEQLVGDIRQPLLILLGAVLLVLLIACANVANLLLARASTRERELAIRAALGASGRRLVRQLLVESVLLAVVGGTLGLLVALWGMDLLLALAPKDSLGMSNVRLDPRVLSFTLLVSGLTGLVFGMAPALQASRPDVNDALKEGSRGMTGGLRSQGTRQTLVVVEVALALVLLVASGLLLKSYLRLQAVNPGFDPRNVLTVRLRLTTSKYAEDPQIIAFFRELTSRAAALPGVRSAGAINFLPFTGLASATGFRIEGRPAPAPGEMPVTEVRVIHPDYFRAMGIPVIKGRIFTEREATQVSHVIAVNETLARQYFPGENPIGRRIVVEMMEHPVPNEIIALVGDVKHMGLDLPARPMVYWPQPELTYSFMTLVVRTDSNPGALGPAIRREVQAMDKDQPVAEIAPMDQVLAASLTRARFSTLLLGGFAAVALLLAMVGIYGVMSYAVVQRTHEIGIRMAMGAGRREVLWMVLGRGARLALIGTAIGAVAAVGLTRLLASLLYGVSASDPATFAGVSALLIGVALAASAIPARRATHVAPMVALRYE